MADSWYHITVDKTTIQKERQKAQKLKKSQWWKTKLNQGICHYCSQKFTPDQLTMDHIVPVARGGKSNPGNVVPACKACNTNKKLETPVEALLESLKKNEDNTE